MFLANLQIHLSCSGLVHSAGLLNCDAVAGSTMRGAVIGIDMEEEAGNGRGDVLSAMGDVLRASAAQFEISSLILHNTFKTFLT